MSVPVTISLSPRPRALASFLRLSAEITGFGQFRLEATGQADSYLARVRAAAGADNADALLARFDEMAAADPLQVERALRIEVFGDERLGPIARHLIKLWFVGTWYALPAEWHDRFGGDPADVTSVVSPAAYVEGLLWPTIGANPPGAKAPGYATWAEPPRIPGA